MRGLRGLLVVMLTMPLLLSNDSTPPPPAPPAPPLVYIYGDSYSAGDPANPNVQAHRWPGFLSQSVRMDIANDAVGLTGYVRADGHSTFPYAVSSDPPADADLVIVFGGFNDRLLTPEAVGFAASVTYRQIRVAAPDAELLVIGMQWPETFTGRDAARPVEAAIERAALAEGATYVDAFDWLQGHPELMDRDGIHPSEAGHRYLARLIGPYVRQSIPA